MTANNGRYKLLQSNAAKPPPSTRSGGGYQAKQAPPPDIKPAQQVHAECAVGSHTPTSGFGCPCYLPTSVVQYGTQLIASYYSFALATRYACQAA